MAPTRSPAWLSRRVPRIGRCSLGTGPDRRRRLRLDRHTSDTRQQQSEVSDPRDRDPCLAAEPGVADDGKPPRLVVRAVGVAFRDVAGVRSRTVVEVSQPSTDAGSASGSASSYQFSPRSTWNAARWTTGEPSRDGGTKTITSPGAPRRRYVDAVARVTTPASGACGGANRSVAVTNTRSPRSRCGSMLPLSTATSGGHVPATTARRANSNRTTAAGATVPRRS